MPGAKHTPVYDVSYELVEILILVTFVGSLLLTQLFLVEVNDEMITEVKL